MTTFCRRHLAAASIAWSLAALVTAVAAQSAFAQNGAQNDPQNGQAAANVAPEVAPPAPPTERGLLSFPTQPPPVEHRGILQSFGHWWDKSVTDLDAKMKDTQKKFDDFNKQQNAAAKEAAIATGDVVKNAAQATKDAAAAVVRLPTTRVVEALHRCDLAPNGAPDCQTAATTVCRGKGFRTGQPLDVSSAQVCPAAVLMSGRTPAEGECPTETTVLRVACQ